jgi:hypothetical protein
MTDTISVEKTVSNLFEIAQGFEKQRKHALAEQVFHAAKTLLEATHGTTNPLYMDCLLHLGLCNQKLGLSRHHRPCRYQIQHPEMLPAESNPDSLADIPCRRLELLMREFVYREKANQYPKKAR